MSHQFWNNVIFFFKGELPDVGRSWRLQADHPPCQWHSRTHWRNDWILHQVTISPTFSEKLLSQFSFSKSVQSLNVSTEKLLKRLSYEKAACKMLVKLVIARPSFVDDLNSFWRIPVFSGRPCVRFNILNWTSSLTWIGLSGLDLPRLGLPKLGLLGLHRPGLGRPGLGSSWTWPFQTLSSGLKLCCFGFLGLGILEDSDFYESEKKT